MSRLDLPAYLALWQQAAAAQTLPPVQAHLSTPELFAGRAYREAHLTATRHLRRRPGAAWRPPQQHGVLQWPAMPMPRIPRSCSWRAWMPAREDAALAAQLPGLLGPAVELSVDDFRWQGRSLGRLHARLAAAGERLQVRELRLAGAQQELRGSLSAAAQARCAAHVSLKSTNLGQTLADYGLRADMGAARAQLEGDLEWPQGSSAPLATLSGDLHMRLEEGARRRQAPDDARRRSRSSWCPGCCRAWPAQAKTGCPRQRRCASRT